MAGYSVDQLYAKLERADAAGDTEAAKVIADEIRKMQAAPKTITPKAPGDAELARQAYDDSSFGQRALISAGAEFKGLGRGIGQIFTPNDSAAHKAITASANADRPFADAPHGGANLVGRALPYLATIPLGGPEAAVAGRLPAGASALARLAAKAIPAAAEGAVYGAAREVRDGESRGQNAAIGAGAGVVGRGIAGGLGKLVAGGKAGIDSVKRELIDIAQREGIPLHISQVGDSLPTKVASSMAKYLPFSGAGGAARAQQDAWNRALTRQAGHESSRITDDAIATMRDNFDKGYGGIWARNDVTLTKGDYDAMQQVLKDTEREFGPNSDAVSVVRAQIDHVLGSADNGVIAGRGYQLLRKQLAGTQPGTAVGGQVGKVRAVLDKAANDSIGPQDAAALKQLNEQYRNFRVLDKLMARKDGATADISPAMLWSAVNQRGPKATKAMRELAKVGQGLLKDPIPDSGTAPRLLIGGAASGAAATGGMSIPMLAKLTLLGATGGRVLNSKAVGNYAANGLKVPQSRLAKLLGTAGLEGVRRLPQGGAAAYDAQPLELNIVGGQAVPAAALDAQLRAAGY